MKQLVVFALFVSACAPSAASVRTGPNLPAKPAGCDVQIFLQKTPERRYEEVGQVEAEGTDNFAELLPLMKDEACKLGADALIGLDHGAAQGYSAGGTASGSAASMSGSSYTKYHSVAVAIRFTD